MQCTNGNTDKTVKTTEENHNHIPTNNTINMTVNQHESGRLSADFHTMPNLPDQSQSQILPSAQQETILTPLTSEKKKTNCRLHKFNTRGVINKSVVKHKVKRKKYKYETYKVSEGR